MGGVPGRAQIGIAHAAPYGPSMRVTPRMGSYPLGDSMNWNKLQSQATPEKPTVPLEVVENESHYAVLIPKNVDLEAIRETAEKGVPFFVGVPKTGMPGPATVMLSVSGENRAEKVRFRLGTWNIFLAKK